MATEIVADHVELAKDFLERSKSYLAQGDLHQASEKGWGAASHIIKAVAAANNWEYESARRFRFRCNQRPSKVSPAGACG